MASQHASMTPRDLSFKVLEEITEYFHEGNKVGSGGYGAVYKGQFQNGEVIAIKKLYQTGVNGIDDMKFEKEFNNLMRVNHQNIVKLVGYCYEIRHKHIEVEGKYHFAEIAERALCFEYLEHGSLDKHISDGSSNLDWCTCYKIIKGISEGLKHLHNGYKGNRIYHLDLKPANILLDENMVPKIADFGLSRMFGSTQTHITTNIEGTLGYVPPEYIEKRYISPKYDVFSLGVIIIQIMAGPEGYTQSAEMSPQEFVERVLENWTKRLPATSVGGAFQDVFSLEVKTCIEIALRCVETDRAKRPIVAEIIKMLNEVETMKGSLLGKSSESKGCFGIDPLELRFPFELNERMSCVLQLMNKSDDFVAFRAMANRSKYSIQPADKGVMPPWSKFYLVTTMLPQEHAPPETQCNDVFIVQSTAVSEGLTPSDITEELFKKTEASSSNKVVVVDEVHLPIVYVTLPQPSSATT